MKLLMSRVVRGPRLPPEGPFKLLSSTGRDGIQRQTIRTWLLSATIEARQEKWALSNSPIDRNNPWCDITHCYVKGTDHSVGDVAFARYLIGQCIVPELAHPDLTVCSIGYSAPKKAWAGWSHRALCFFEIGDRVFQPHYGNDNTPFTKHGVVEIRSMEQARESAIAFADYVS